MSSVPIIFAGDTGNIPLEYLDINFANVKLSVDYVIQNAQANITSLGTLTSLSVSGNIVHSGNLIITGNIIATDQLDIQTTAGNSNIALSPHGTGQVTVSTQLSVVGNITGGNITTPGQVVSTGNILTSGSVSATGNVFCNVVTANTVTAPTFDSANVSFTGNIIVAGNAQVNGTTTFINTQNLNITDKNITIANGVSTSALIDGAGIDAGNPTVAYIRYSDAAQGWTTANSFSVGTTLSVTGNATLSGNTALSGVSTAPTAANTTANTQIATTAFVRNIIPTGVITMWYGNIASIPNGWYLCDGSNGTPDLRNVFIIGANADDSGVAKTTVTGSATQTGGSKDAVLVSHTHTASVTDPGHNHTETIYGSLANQTGSSTPCWTGTANANTSTATTGISVSNSTEGVSGTNANLPPYYALAYIMKA